MQQLMFVYNVMFVYINKNISACKLNRFNWAIVFISVRFDLHHKNGALSTIFCSKILCETSIQFKRIWYTKVKTSLYKLNYAQVFEFLNAFLDGCETVEDEHHYQ